MSVCECNHLTTFGSFFVEPNALKPFSFALLKESYVLMVAVATILLLYLVGLIFTRRADQEDTSKVCVHYTTLCPQKQQNSPEGIY